MQKDDDDGDSMLSSATSDTSSTKRKRFAASRRLRPLASVCFDLRFASSHKKNTKKNRMKILLAAVTEAREAGTGRRLCDLFMFKPSKKDYPDYYKIILEPMDLRTIEHNIRSDRYVTEDEMVEDMKLMFRNARHYNEEGSQVRSDLLKPMSFPVQPPGELPMTPVLPILVFAQGLQRCGRPGEDPDGQTPGARPGEG